MTEPFDITPFIKSFDLKSVDLEAFGAPIDLPGLREGTTIEIAGDYSEELARRVEREIQRWEALLPNEGDSVTLECDGDEYHCVVATRTTNGDGDTVITFTRTL